MSVVQNSDSRVNGRWTKLQHQKFLEGLQLYGRNWKKIQELVGTRNGSQIRSHAQKFFLKVKKTLGQFQNVEQNLDCSSELDSSKVLSRKQTIVEEEIGCHSFFMSEIIKKTSNDQEFNFWEMFIDVGDLKNEGEINIIYQRKGSFALIQTNEGKIQSPIDCLGHNSQ